MRAARLASIVVPFLLSACTDAREPYIIAGPTAPSRVATEQPLMWNTRAELADWVENGVTQGSVTLEDEGREAFVRVRLGSARTVLRGPDLTVAAEGVRGARVRVRMRYDRERSPGAVPTERLDLRFEVLRPSTLQQPSMYVNVLPSEDWQELTLRPGLYCCTSPLTVRYAYVDLGSTIPTTLDIDWIAFIR